MAVNELKPLQRKADGAVSGITANNQVPGKMGEGQAVLFLDVCSLFVCQHLMLI